MSRLGMALITVIVLQLEACQTEGERGIDSARAVNDLHWIPLIYPIEQYRFSTGDRSLVVLSYNEWGSGGVLLRNHLLKDPLLKRPAELHRPVFLKADFTSLSGAGWNEVQARRRSACQAILIISRSKRERLLQPDFTQRDLPHEMARLAAAIANGLE
ncbi:MAG: hypothetical protein ACKV19_27540 [Verrucomicrobiales bacterium]